MIEIIKGVQNSGKTLYAVKRTYEDFLTGRKILTNTPVSFKHKIITYDELKEYAINTVNLVNTTILLDEIWLWMDALTPGSNRILSYFFLQSSKTDLRIYVTVQYINQLSNRLRDNAHRLSTCTRFIKVGEEYREIDNETRKLPEELQSLLYIMVETNKKRDINLETFWTHHESKLVEAKPIFKLYNTEYRIKPKPTNKELKEKMIENERNTKHK